MTSKVFLQIWSTETQSCQGMFCMHSVSSGVRPSIWSLLLWITRHVSEDTGSDCLTDVVLHNYFSLSLKAPCLPGQERTKLHPIKPVLQSFSFPTVDCEAYRPEDWVHSEETTLLPEANQHPGQYRGAAQKKTRRRKIQSDINVNRNARQRCSDCCWTERIDQRQQNRLYHIFTLCLRWIVLILHDDM